MDVPSWRAAGDPPARLTGKLCETRHHLKYLARPPPDVGQHRNAQWRIYKWPSEAARRALRPRFTIDSHASESGRAIFGRGRVTAGDAHFLPDVFTGAIV